MTLHQEYLIALGGNLPSEAGTPGKTLRAALDDLAAEGVRIGGVSRFYQTPCFPAGAGPDYVNAAARITYAGGAEDAGNARAVLALLHRIETTYGRKRLERWGRRTLDIDLIAAGDTVMPDHGTHAAWRDLPADEQTLRAPDQLILPHPRVQDRAFVLIPLADVAPDWRHPVLEQSVSEMLAALPQADRDAVIPL